MVRAPHLAVRAAAVLALASAPGAASPPGELCGTGNIVPAGPVVQQTWTPAGSPYCVTADIQVTGLTIEPGVVVLLSSSVDIEVVSDLVARGTARRPIRFLRSDVDQQNRWGTIRFDHTPDGSVLEHCVIEGAVRGVHATNSRPVIRSCLIRDNEVGVEWYLDQGLARMVDTVVTENVKDGGVQATLGAGAELALDRCQLTANRDENGFSNNFARGTGIEVEGGRLTLRNCLVRGNFGFARRNSPLTVGDTYALGGGVYVEDGDLVMEACLVLGNRAWAESVGAATYANALGGGVYVEHGTADLRNCVVAGNGLRAEGTMGGFSVAGGVYLGLSSASFENCTVAGNEQEGVYGTSLSTNPTTIRVHDSIFHGNDTQILSQNPLLTLDVSWSVVQGGFPGTGILDVDPLFAGAGDDTLDWFVRSGSPCVDAGDPAPAHDDACPGSSFGTARNDIGAGGGPANCAWGRAALPYCTGKTNSLGCVPFLTASGTPSASSSGPFDVTAWNVAFFESGFFLASTERAELDFHGARLCVGTPFARLRPTKTSRFGASFACPGVFSRDLSPAIRSGADPVLTVGSRVHLQFLQRDAGDPSGFGDGLTNALQFVVQP